MNIQNNKSTTDYKGSITSSAINRSDQANDTTNNNHTSKTDNNKNRDSILATELNMNQQDSVTMKKIKAHKEAMKTIIDQFTSDQKIDDNLKSRREHISALNNVIAESQNEVRTIEDLKHQVKDSFAVTDDSEEQSNLKLLEKQNESLKKGSLVKLTDQEKQKLKTMGPKTEYQLAILDYDKIQDVWKENIKVAKNEQQGEKGIIKGIRDALLQIHPMADAKIEEKNILDTANEEVIGMLIGEAKDHVDEEHDKEEEKATKEAEKKAKEDAIKEKAAQNNTTLNNDKTDNNSDNSNSDKTSGPSSSNSIDNMSQIQNAASEQQKFQVELKNLVDNQKLTVDDSKGIVVDKQL